MEVLLSNVQNGFIVIFCTVYSVEDNVRDVCYHYHACKAQERIFFFNILHSVNYDSFVPLLANKCTQFIRITTLF